MLAYMTFTPYFTTSVRQFSAKIDASADTQIQSMALLYDEFRYDSVKIYHFYAATDATAAQALACTVMAVDINSDGSTPVTLGTCLNMEHKCIMQMGKPEWDILKVPFKSVSSAGGTWPPWQKCSLLSSFYPGGIYVASQGFPASNTSVNMLVEMKLSFRTRQ
jgi:hypothetical protein